MKDILSVRVDLNSLWDAHIESFGPNLYHESKRISLQEYEQVAADAERWRKLERLMDKVEVATFIQKSTRETIIQYWNTIESCKGKAVHEGTTLSQAIDSIKE